MYKKMIYKQLFFLALPMILQQFVTIAINFTDSVMVGRLGIYDIAAVGFANKIFFIALLTIFGILGGFSIFIAQFYGKKDMEMVRKLFAFATITTAIIGVVISIIAFVWAENIIRIFSSDQVVIGIGEKYLKVVALSYPLLAITLTFMTVLRSMGNTALPLVITIIAAVVNVIFNYLLIYGNYGFPKLGSTGAGIATLIARAVEVAIVIFIFFYMDYGLRCKIKSYFGLSKDFIKELVQVSTPVFFTEFLWVIGTTLLGVAYAMLGTQVAAAVQISDMAVSIGSIIFLGIAVGANIIIAQNIGAGKKNRIFLIAKDMIKVALVFATITVLLSLILIKPILSFYVLDEQTHDIARNLLILFSLIMFFKLLNWTTIVGILRAGGDTQFVFWLDVTLLLLFAVPLAFLGATIWGLNIYLIVIIANLEELFKLIIALWRFKTGKWINDLTKIK
jgi:putative MATE family efflux protein